MMKASMIAGAMAMEEALAREEGRSYDKVLNNLPDGHPLRLEAEKARRQVEDLSDIPAGHPLRVALDQAKRHFEEFQESQHQELEPTEGQIAQVRKAKRIEDNRARRAERIKEEERESKVRMAAKTYNGAIDDLIGAVKLMSMNAYATKGDCQENQYVQMRVDRLERLLSAFERGLNDSKLRVGRASNG
jgi:hypothetical protein